MDFVLTGLSSMCVCRRKNKDSGKSGRDARTRLPFPRHLPSPWFDSGAAAHFVDQVSRIRYLDAGSLRVLGEIGHLGLTMSGASPDWTVLRLFIGREFPRADLSASPRRKRTIGSRKFPACQR